MEDLKVGDRVIALKNPFVPEGAEGVIGESDGSNIPYHVLFDDGSVWWLCRHQVKRITASAQQPKKRELRVGDKVRIKSREWYEANKNRDGTVFVRGHFVSEMSKFLGNIMEIEYADGGGFFRLKGGGDWTFSNEMFEDEVGDSTDTAPSLIEKYRDVVASIFTSDSKPSVSGDLIKRNKLLTNIKLD